MTKQKTDKWTRLTLKLRRAIERYASAQVEASWKGSRDPDDFPAIEAEVVNAKEHLVATIIGEREAKQA